MDYLARIVGPVGPCSKSFLEDNNNKTNDDILKLLSYL